MITLNNFQIWDLLYREAVHEKTEKAYLNQKGELLRLQFNDHGTRYTEVIKTESAGDVVTEYDRPILGGQSEAEYYTELISQAKHEGKDIKAIKHLISLHQQALKHEDIENKFKEKRERQRERRAKYIKDGRKIPKTLW